MATNSTQQYRTNAKSRAKHVRDNSPGGKYAHSKKYKRKHAKLRDKLKCKKNEDVSKRKGKWVCESLKINRGRGGAKRK